MTCWQKAQEMNSVVLRATLKCLDGDQRAGATSSCLCVSCWALPFHVYLSRCWGQTVTGVIPLTCRIRDPLLVNLFVLLWTQRWCKLCLFIPVRIFFVKKNKGSTTKIRKKKEKFSVLSRYFNKKNKQGARGWDFFLFNTIIIIYVFQFCLLFCWLIQDKR